MNHEARKFAFIAMCGWACLSIWSGMRLATALFSEPVSGLGVLGWTLSCVFDMAMAIHAFVYWDKEGR